MKASTHCRRGHLKEGVKVRGPIRFNYCKVCHNQGQKSYYDGFTSVRLSKMLYVDIRESAKAHGTAVKDEVSRLLTLALANERRHRP